MDFLSDDKQDKSHYSEWVMEYDKNNLSNSNMNKAKKELYLNSCNDYSILKQSYSNTNYHLLALIVEQVSGMKLNEYLQELINSDFLSVFKFREIKVKRIVKRKLPLLAELKHSRRGNCLGQ